jgi:hypothetical protein
MRNTPTTSFVSLSQTKMVYQCSTTRRPRSRRFMLDFVKSFKAAYLSQADFMSFLGSHTPHFGAIKCGLWHDFTNIHCSAKCAARIGQAFSDTIFAVRIPSTATVLETKVDVVRNGRVFSDGCGTMSLELFQLLWRALQYRQRQKRPTILQIRYRGAKGVLSLDKSLAGEQLHIRESMTKYVARADWRALRRRL